MTQEIKILDAEEAAGALRLTTRRLIKVAKKHGLCLIYGRKIMFTPAQLADIVEVMKCPPKDGIRPASGGSSPEQAFESLRALAIARSQKRPASRKKGG